jgi:serine/alanine adding enzyme
MIEVVQYEEKDRKAWDDYTSSHPGASCYHLIAWKRALEQAYNHKSYYLIARTTETKDGDNLRRGKILGVFPLVHLKHFMFGNSLLSLPFCDYGGMLADGEAISDRLLQRSIELCASLDHAILELRNSERLLSTRLTTYSPKLRMVLDLDGDSERLWKGLAAKLRSQIRRPQKEGLIARIGGMDLLQDFYRVFSFNMRDLGSPVHSKALIGAVLKEFGASSKLQVVYYGNAPVAAGLIICFRDAVYIPWASTVRQFNRLSPNMMLYWNFLKYAADEGFRKFDFGRCSPQEGTYNFKEQWGAKASPLYWQYGSQHTAHELPDNLARKERYQWLASLWKRLPLPVANMAGPLIRKHISL